MVCCLADGHSYILVLFEKCVTYAYHNRSSLISFVA